MAIKYRDSLIQCRFDALPIFRVFPQVVMKPTLDRDKLSTIRGNVFEKALSCTVGYHLIFRSMEGIDRCSIVFQVFMAFQLIAEQPRYWIDHEPPVGLRLQAVEWRFQDDFCGLVFPSQVGSKP